MSMQLPPPDDLDDWAEYSHAMAKDLYAAFPGGDNDPKIARMSILTMTVTYMIMSHFPRKEWVEMAQSFGEILLRNLKLAHDGEV